MSSQELSDRYQPSAVEEKNYRFWVEHNFFEAQDQSTKPPFAVIMPPPNVTGSLHLGHALDQTIQDLYTRWKRMSGFNALWLPGTDHAGISTQIVVEKELKKQGLDRRQMGREAFSKKVWEWKEKYGNRILEQCKKLGDSVDWRREKFTLDEDVSSAVRKVFVSLYKEGLIYRGQRLVNWDPQLETAVSDLEVDNEERKGSLWHIKYPIENSTEFLTVATTRPETLLGDTAVCVHPQDDRYKKWIGKNVILPLLKRKIPIISDEYVDREFGSGVVKITPAHDFNDYEIGKRHKLPLINILNANGTLNQNGGSYKNLKVQEARKKVLEDLIAADQLVKEESHRQIVPVSERTGIIVEPFLSDQWFVSIQKLARPAKAVVENGSIQFVPEQWAKTYLHWMNNIQDWCISRQLWWGHRIPAWYCADCKHVTVSETDPTECEKCHSKKIHQEEDVLDTWFSSGLWPFSTLGWPEQTEALKTFYPTSLMVTGHDIIFFWVARMIMNGIHFAKDIPFRTVYIHGLVRDAQGRKMSKSLGNGIDPIDIIEKYGADALRFTLLAQVASGKDLKFSEQRLEGYRNFMNKIWNATRFALTNLKDLQNATETVDRDHLSLADHWILSRLSEVEGQTSNYLEHYRISETANGLYSFVWNDFCDWYLEFIKPVVYGENPQAKKATLTVLAVTLNRIMRLLHPFIPFITEELYQKLPIHGEACVIDSYPTVENDRKWLSNVDKTKAYEMNILKEVTTALRNIRGENQIKPGQKIGVRLGVENTQLSQILLKNQPSLQKLAGIDAYEVGTKVSDHKSAKQLVMIGKDKIFVVVPLEGLVDLAAEVTRLQKNLEKVLKEIDGTKKQLSNENFVKNAPDDIVQEAKLKLSQLEEQSVNIKESMQRLK